MKGKLFASINIVLAFIIVVILNVISNYWNVEVDLTGDKRFTLSQPSKSLLKEIDEPIYVKVLLDGQFPAAFKRLQGETTDLLEKFHTINPKLEFDLENPSAGSIQQINQTRQELSNEGILPTTLRFAQGDQQTSKQIYPYAIFHLGQRKVAVNLLEDQQQGISEEVILNNSVSLLEYKFTGAIQKLISVDKPVVLITSGNGELPGIQTAALEAELINYCQIGRVSLDSIYGISPEVDLLILIKPTIGYSERDKFIIDQYIMRGGKVIWLIDYLKVNLDSINRNKFYVPPVMELNLEDMFFSYGIRYKTNLVLDLECTRIPQVIGMVGDQPQIEMMNWPYHPLVYASSDHPIVNNIGRVNLFFPGSIDTVQAVPALQNVFLLRSSEYTRYQMTPVRLSFDILQYGFDPNKFDKDPQNFAVLVSGKFQSLYKNRVAGAMLEMLNQIDQEFRDESLYTQQLFVSDGDFIKNLYDPQGGKITPIGYNKWEKRIYRGNQSFILNAIEFMLDQRGLLASRSKEVKLRLMNVAKARSEKLKWRMINICLPLAILFLFGIIFNLYRRKKYTK